ncbi:MAG: DUF1134 domain-containing protein [Hyphomicrobium sp.]|uniref:DUF1134 domain-containing protein n=1 Tax=Hyphomicrobium sp. TaxID=82 RepID=UPI003D0E3941
MTMPSRPRLLPLIAGAALLFASPAIAQDTWSPDSYRSGGESSAAPRGDSYGSANRGYGYGGDSGSGSSSNGYAAPSRDTYAAGGGDSYNAPRDGYAANGESYAPDRGYGANDAYSPSGNGGYGGGDAYSPSRDAYSGGGDSYAPASRYGRSDSYSDPGQPADGGGPGGYGAPYAPPPGEEAYRDGGPPPPRRHYEQNEIVSAGHGFFGAISQGLGEAVEYAFKSQGRPNGYILGEDAGGAFMVGLRYGEGTLYTKDAGDHKVFWQGPSLGYDFGGEGSKAMVLVYNLHDPAEIYNRFGGVQGAAYLVGGLSVQFQTYGHVTLAVIRSGVGLRLGANVGYLKYTRSPTWNPL